MSDQDPSSKTEEPTPERKKKARDDRWPKIEKSQVKPLQKALQGIQKADHPVRREAHERARDIARWWR